MEKFKIIGKGQFSTAYQYKAVVYIKSQDPVKECMALFPINSSFFPKVSLSDLPEFDYKMPLYNKVRAPKRQLNDRSLLIYQELRGLFTQNCFDYNKKESGYTKWFVLFSGIKSSVSVKNALIDAIGNLSNYGDDIGFEISPRNIAATKSGNLILLDCFFIKSALKGGF